MIQVSFYRGNPLLPVLFQPPIQCDLYVPTVSCGHPVSSVKDSLSSLYLSFSLPRSSIDSEPDLVLGPLKSQQEQRREQQLAEIKTRREEREKKGPEEEGSKPPVQEMVEELQGPFHYEFSYWARYVAFPVKGRVWFSMHLCFCVSELFIPFLKEEENA